jgi:hypothetical protein
MALGEKYHLTCDLEKVYESTETTTADDSQGATDDDAKTNNSTETANLDESQGAKNPATESIRNVWSSLLPVNKRPTPKSEATTL